MKKFKVQTTTETEINVNLPAYFVNTYEDDYGDGTTTYYACFDDFYLSIAFEYSDYDIKNTDSISFSRETYGNRWSFSYGYSEITEERFNEIQEKAINEVKKLGIKF